MQKAPKLYALVASGLHLLKGRMLMWFLLLYSTQGLEAQKDLITINFTINNGLPSNNVYFALQDHLGYMWFSTDKGVVRFDGIKMTTFTTADGLSDNECFEIFEDSKHRIWFAAYNGKPCYYYNGVFHNPENDPILKKVNSSTAGFRYMEDAKGVIYFITTNAYFEITDTKVRKILPGKPFLSSGFISSSGEPFIMGGKGKNYIGILFPTSNPQKHFELPGSGFGVTYSTKVHHSKDVIYYFAENYLNSYNLKTKKSLGYAFEKSLHGQSICIINDQLWFGTNTGLYILKNNKWQSLLKGKSVTSVVKDREQNIWITSLNHGVDLIVNPKILHYNYNSGLGFNKCNSISVLDQNLIAIGSENFQFGLIRNGKASHLNTKYAIGTGIVRQVKKWQNQYYVCDGSNLSVFGSNWQPTVSYPFSSKDIHLLNKDTIISVGGYGINLIHVHPNGLEAELTNTMIPNKATLIYKLSDGQLIALGPGGVKYIVKNDTKPFHTSNWLQGNMVDVMETKEGIIWFASSIHGLVAYYKGAVYVYNTKKGLSSNYISSICKGKGNSIWLGSTKGIMKVNYSLKGKVPQLKISKFNRSHGLIADMINDVMFINDSLWFATPNGVGICKPDDLQHEKPKPLLNIIEFKASGKNIPIQKQMHLDADQNNIKIRFSGLSFFSLGHIRYRYRLKGLQNEWNLSSNNQIEYPTLPFGKYQLEIVSIDAMGVESLPKILRFEIAPHFYETWLFYIFLFLFVSALTWRYIRIRIKRLKLSHSLQAQVWELENEKLRIERHDANLMKEYYELEQKALLLQMNPHFIFNSINTIQGLYKRNREQGDDYLIKFSSMLRNILEFSRSRVIPLEREIEFMKLYLEINLLRFEHGFEYDFDISEKVHVASIRISPMIIQPFVENALIHGIGSLENGKIHIRFRLENNLLICEIEDNGVGREAAGKRQLNRSHQSLGMDITSKRLKLFNKDDQNESSIEIIDLYDDKGKASGTKVILHIAYE